MSNLLEFGKEEALRFGDIITRNLSGRTISKRKDKADQPGGLIYEARLLSVDHCDMLSALEGMCADGRAKEIDDSTYLITNIK